MSIAAVLLAPLYLLVPAAGSVEQASDMAEPVSVEPQVPAEQLARPPVEPVRWPSFEKVAEAFRAESANQVRIEQHTIIRIAPRPAPPQATLLMDLPRGQIAGRFAERSIGRCLPAAGIAGVQIDRSDRLILFMRDRRIISAQLERACRARDFYSGFYVDRSSDGRICVDRDTLQSRSGTNCKLTRIRQLVEIDE